MGDIHQQRRSVNDPCRNLARSTKRVIFPSHYFLCKVERQYISRTERSDVCLTLPVVPSGFKSCSFHFEFDMSFENYYKCMLISYVFGRFQSLFYQKLLNVSASKKLQPFLSENYLTTASSTYRIT